jgi:predicted transposase/invertase (TIGR01784 family)
MKKVLGIEPESMLEIPDDLQRTIERYPDFLKIITGKSSDVFVLHIEYQAADDDEMLERMLEYFSLLYRKYRLEIKQYIFYIGSSKTKMKNTLSLPNINYRYELISLQDISYKVFLNSEIPEEIILAILGDFEGKEPQKVIFELLDKLDDLETGTLRMEKCVKQLEILSVLRNLQAIIIEQIHMNMALRYDIKKDLRYLQGKEEGKEEGREEGREEGEQIKTLIGVRRAIKKGKLSIEDIADIFEVSVEYVNQIKKEIGL